MVIFLDSLQQNKFTSYEKKHTTKRNLLNLETKKSKIYKKKIFFDKIFWKTKILLVLFFSGVAIS